MKNFTSVNYSDIIPSTFLFPSRNSGEFIKHKPIISDWGQLTLSDITLPQFQVVQFEGRIEQNIHLYKKDYDEPQTVDSCIFLEGTIESDFAGLDESMVMGRGMQNFIYKPDATDNHYIKAQEAIKLLHVSVDRLYYATLLSEQEKWSADLREKLLNKKLICGSTEHMQMSPQMFQIVGDILSCPLSGNLRNLVLEAKVLELIALQLNQLVKETYGRTAQKIKSADRDALYALREFLHKTFTKDHSLRNLAMTFGLNEFKLKKGFKELFGTTVFDYLHDLKMEYAKQLLAADEVFVNEVSGIVGYKNPNHFSTAFKRKYGVNPAQLKNKTFC